MSRWFVVACLCLAGCHAASFDAGFSNKLESPKDKGFIEWVQGLFNPTTPPSEIDFDPEPTEKDCPPCKCGIPRTRRRIVGGTETKEREYPWMVMLLYNGRMFCGGSLISDLYVLTAAHCTGFRKDRMTVRLLEHDVTSRGNESKTIDRKVSKIIRHQKYNPGTYDNDIALLKLNERIDFTNAIKKHARSDDDDTATTIEAESTSTSSPEEDDVNVHPVCLPLNGLSYTADCGLVIGWGTTEQGGSVSPTLQEVKVPIVSNKECRDRSYGRRVTENMLCAGLPEGGQDACQGDSGGPLHIFNETTGRYHEVGVVSWGEGCAQPNKYGVYSRVNRYLTWIKSNTQDGCYCD